MEYIPTIGLEVHAELKTRTKMFCDSLNDPDFSTRLGAGEKRPNMNVCPVCLGHPGTLPTINKKAVEEVIKVGLALGGKINSTAKFDRKNYFYPDLPKGYQISQYDEPLVIGGGLNGVRLRRIHLEEDAGKLVHLTSSNSQLATGKEEPEARSKKPIVSFVDFNRAGAPLMELVTEPDITTAEEAVAFGKEFQLILRYVGASDADMERGQMRLEANVSIHPSNTETLGTKVEVKNINSFKALGSAIAYELERQKEILEKGEKVQHETRGWDDANQKTVSQRSKEEAHDYRYFPEPDLPPFETSIFDIEKMRVEIPELPAAKRERFREQFSYLSETQILSLIEDEMRAEYFEEMDSEILSLWENEDRFVNEEVKQKFLENAQKRGYRMLANDLQERINRAGDNMAIGYKKILPKDLASLAFKVEYGLQGPLGEESTEIGRRAVQEIIDEMYETKESLENISKRREEKGHSIYTISNKAQLELVVHEVIAENQIAIADYKKGKTASMQFLVGKAMGKLKGRGNPEALKTLFERGLIK